MNTAPAMATIRRRIRCSEENLLARSDQAKRSGTDINTLSKIVTRVSINVTLFQDLCTAEGERIFYAVTVADSSTRCTLADGSHRTRVYT